MEHTNNETTQGESKNASCLSPGDALQISRFLDGDLSRAQTARLKERMDNDAALRREWEALGQIRATVREAPALADTTGARDRVFTRLERAARQEAHLARRSRRWLTGGRGGAAVGLAAAAALGIVFLLPGERATPDTPLRLEAREASARVPLPRAEEIETLSRLHDAQQAEGTPADVPEESL